MPPGLLAIAEDGEAARVGPGERVGGGGRGGGGADRGDLAGLEHRRRRAGLRIEQHDDALVRAAAPGEILGIDADQLGAERAVVEHRAGHHPEGAALGRGR